MASGFDDGELVAWAPDADVLITRRRPIPERFLQQAQRLRSVQHIGGVPRPEVASWAALRYGFTPAEALTAVTLNAAASLDLGARLGTLEPGKQADVVVTDLPSAQHLAYELARSPVRAVVKRGRVVHARGPRPNWR